MGNLSKIFLLKIFTFLIIFIQVVNAGCDERREIVHDIMSLYCSPNDDEVVIRFLYDLCHLQMSFSHELFEYMLGNRKDLSVDLKCALESKNILKQDFRINEKLVQDVAFRDNLSKVFCFLKKIVDDFNKENKDDCLIRCCRGCIPCWRRENGMREIEFSINTVTTLISAFFDNSIPMQTSDNLSDHVEYALRRLSGRIDV